MRILQTTLLGLLSVGLFAIALPASAGVIVGTDTVEAAGDYTQTNVTGDISPLSTRASGSFGLAATALANWVEASNGGVGAAGSGTITHTAGFGGGALIAAGTYKLSVDAGRVNLALLNRDAPLTFESFLRTTVAGTDLPGRVVTTPYSLPAQATFNTVVVEYTVLMGDTLIGDEFTWGFDYTFGDPIRGFMTPFDNVSVHFEAAVIPEPSSLMLVSLGMIGLIGFNRRRK